jgi:dihydroceramidase
MDENHAADPGALGFKIFEHLPTYLQENHGGFWGDMPTASIDWCERNYVVTEYIAEFWNSISNVFFIIFSLWGLHQVKRMETRFTSLYSCVLLVGLGSIAFHSTLRHVGQQGDETPMILAMLAWAYCLLLMRPSVSQKYPWAPATLAVVFLVYGLLWSVLHYMNSFVILFQVHFGTLLCLCLTLVVRELSVCEDPGARKLGKGYIGFTALGFVLWLLDQLLCDTWHTIGNPQLHAWWHFLVGIASYCGPSFLAYMRAHYLGLTPKVKYCYWVLPYVIYSEKQL